jgi:hypothetical protein
LEHLCTDVKKDPSTQYLYTGAAAAALDSNMKYLAAILLLNCFPFLSAVGAATSTASQYPSVSLPLSPLFDNQAASADGSADFDAHGASFDSQYLPPGPWVYDGITVRRK